MQQLKDFERIKEEHRRQGQILEIMEDDDFQERLETLIAYADEHRDFLPQGYVIWGREMPDLPMAEPEPVSRPRVSRPRGGANSNHPGITRGVLALLKRHTENGEFVAARTLYGAFDQYNIPIQHFKSILASIAYLKQAEHDGNLDTSARKWRINQEGLMRLSTPPHSKMYKNGDLVAPSGEEEEREEEQEEEQAAPVPKPSVDEEPKEEPEGVGLTAKILAALATLDPKGGYAAYSDIQDKVNQTYYGGKLDEIPFRRNFAHLIRRGYLMPKENVFNPNGGRALRRTTYRLSRRGAEYLREKAPLEEDGSAEVPPPPEAAPPAQPAPQPLTQSAIEGLLPASHSELKDALVDAGYDVSDLGATLHRLRDDGLIHLEAGQFAVGPPRQKRLLLAEEEDSAGKFSIPDGEDAPDLKVTLNPVQVNILRLLPLKGASLSNDAIKKASRLDDASFGVIMSRLTKMRLVRSGGNRVSLTESGKILRSKFDEMLVHQMTKKV